MFNKFSVRPVDLNPEMAELARVTLDPFRRRQHRYMMLSEDRADKLEVAIHEALNKAYEAGRLRERRLRPES